MQTRDPITEQFREAVRQSEQEAFPALEQVWERVTLQLDEEQKQRRSAIPFRKISLAAAVLIVIGLGIVWVSRDTPDLELKSLAQQEVGKLEKQVVTGSAAPPEQAEVARTPDKRLVQHQQVGRPVPGRRHATSISQELASTPAPQQDVPERRMIKGMVIDEDGETVPGAMVKIKGINDGTVTDEDGKYELEVKGDAVLEIAALGWESQDIRVSPGKQESITTRLTADKNLLAGLEIATPYGPPVSRERYVGAADALPSKRLERMPVSDITRAIERAAPGIQITLGSGQPGSSSQIRMRGTGSLSSNKQPLYVLDGTLYTGDITKLNPKDIKSINLLKEARATALYGSRGANGVISITTKNAQTVKHKTGFFRRIKRLFGKKTVYNNITPQAATVPEQAVANTETYNPLIENPFESPAANPLSTFSIDVDNAAYTNIRRFIHNGQAVPKDAVRIEEMINFFSYKYPQPQGPHPFSINTDYSDAPWNPGHRLLRIGLQGKVIPPRQLPPSNLVFLIDVSGSMSDDNKLPLLKASMKLLVGRLRKEDQVAIVVYAGAAGLVLPSTPGDRKEDIIRALDQLEAGGSTAGGQGIELAYKIAREHFKKEGNNRVILATDGDFNVGASSDADMQTLIEEKRKSNIFLTCLGYGMGNYKDSKMEILADKGNGNYAYIDNLQEANRFLVKEFAGTLYSIAKDVKIQVVFNPQYVQSYRLIGYENRKLKDEDFVNDAIDAGELGSGHRVTALYEIIPAGLKSAYAPDTSRLRHTPVQGQATRFGEELAIVKFRYKKPDGDASTEIVQAVDHKPLSPDCTSADFKLAAAVAWFGLKLRDSKLVQDTSRNAMLQLAQAAVQDDKEGYKAELVRLIETAR